jgi:hypothetical protein
MWTRAKLGGGGLMRTFPTAYGERPVGCGLMRTFPTNWAKKQGSWPLDASFPHSGGNVRRFRGACVSFHGSPSRAVQPCLTARSEMLLTPYFVLALRA